MELIPNRACLGKPVSPVLETRPRRARVSARLTGFPSSLPCSLLSSLPPPSAWTSRAGFVCKLFPLACPVPRSKVPRPEWVVNTGRSSNPSHLAEEQPPKSYYLLFTLFSVPCQQGSWSLCLQPPPPLILSDSCVDVSILSQLLQKTDITGRIY